MQNRWSAVRVEEVVVGWVMVGQIMLLMVFGAGMLVAVGGSIVKDWKEAHEKVDVNRLEQEMRRRGMLS